MSLIRDVHLEIDGDFSDSAAVWLRFLQVMRGLNVTVVGAIKHDFPGGGFTGLILLAESHAAIHTYPEYGRAWVELATCGNPDDLDTFTALVQDIGLSPERLS